MRRVTGRNKNWPDDEFPRERAREHASLGTQGSCLPAWRSLMATIEPFWREWRELGAARCLVLAIADASSGPLTKRDANVAAELRVSAVCDAVERCLEQLAHSPSPHLFRLARACGSADREGCKRLLNTAFLLWGDAIGHGRLRSKLERRAQALAGPNGAAIFQKVVVDALWVAEAGDGIVTRQRRRNWKGVREVSLEILPSRDQDGRRCTLEHFNAVAERIKKTRPHDRNLPRTPDAVGELFYLFCPCCVDVPDPRLPGYAGPVQGPNNGAAEEDPDALEEAEEAAFGPTPDEAMDAMDDVAPNAAAALIKAFKTEVAALPPHDQVVLSNLLREFAIVAFAARRAYPTLNAEAVKSRGRVAAILGITPQRLAEDRRRMNDWLDDISQKLQDRLLPPKGAE